MFNLLFLREDLSLTWLGWLDSKLQEPARPLLPRAGFIGVFHPCLAVEAGDLPKGLRLTLQAPLPRDLSPKPRISLLKSLYPVFYCTGVLGVYHVLDLQEYNLWLNQQIMFTALVGCGKVLVQDPESTHRHHRACMVPHMLSCSLEKPLMSRWHGAWEAIGLAAVELPLQGFVKDTWYHLCSHEIFSEKAPLLWTLASSPHCEAVGIVGLFGWWDDFFIEINYILTHVFIYSANTKRRLSIKHWPVPKTNNECKQVCTPS